MKRLFAALCAVCFVASATPQGEDEFLKGEALQAEIAKSCANGCITFNHEEAAAFQDALERLLAQKQKEAYQAGQRNQKAACASLI
jgi:hypothetical protein